MESEFSEGADVAFPLNAGGEVSEMVRFNTHCDSREANQV
jgi:hypothetical protein